jgi:hypothetical protein
LGTGRTAGPGGSPAKLRLRYRAAGAHLLQFRQRRRDRRVAVEHVAGVAVGFALQVAGQQRLA